MTKSGPKPRPKPRPFKGHEVTAGSSSRIYTGETYLFLLVRVTLFFYLNILFASYSCLVSEKSFSAHTWSSFKICSAKAWPVMSFKKTLQSSFYCAVIKDSLSRKTLLASGVVDVADLLLDAPDFGFVIKSSLLSCCACAFTRACSLLGKNPPIFS